MEKLSNEKTLVTMVVSLILELEPNIFWLHKPLLELKAIEIINLVELYQTIQNQGDQNESNRLRSKSSKIRG